MHAYIAFDGDNVGRNLEYLMVASDETIITSFAEHFRESRDWFVAQVGERMPCEVQVVFAGGDNGLLKIPSGSLDIPILQALLAEFAERSAEWFRQTFSSHEGVMVPNDITLSLGIGGCPREAFIALNVSKARGKNCLTRFRELIDG